MTSLFRLFSRKYSFHTAFLFFGLFFFYIVVVFFFFIQHCNLSLVLDYVLRSSGPLFHPINTSNVIKPTRYPNKEYCDKNSKLTMSCLRPSSIFLNESVFKEKIRFEIIRNPILIKTTYKQHSLDNDFFS